MRTQSPPSRPRYHGSTLSGALVAVYLTSIVLLCIKAWGVMLALGGLYHNGVIDKPFSYNSSLLIAVIATLLFSFNASAEVK